MMCEVWFHSSKSELINIPTLPHRNECRSNPMDTCELPRSRRLPDANTVRGHHCQ